MPPSTVNNTAASAIMANIPATKSRASSAAIGKTATKALINEDPFMNSLHKHWKQVRGGSGGYPDFLIFGSLTVFWFNWSVPYDDKKKVWAVEEFIKLRDEGKVIEFSPGLATFDQRLRLLLLIT